jgi:hypothetical protein
MLVGGNEPRRPAPICCGKNAPVTFRAAGSASSPTLLTDKSATAPHFLPFFLLLQPAIPADTIRTAAPSHFYKPPTQHGTYDPRIYTIAGYVRRLASISASGPDAYLGNKRGDDNFGEPDSSSHCCVQRNTYRKLFGGLISFRRLTST